MNLLATQQTNIRVDYMKRYLYYAFLCLTLSGCGGGEDDGGSTSSSKKAKAAKACTTPMANGKGELPWDKKTKKYSTTCKVISCNTGYVKNTGTNRCDIPVLGKYVDNLGREKSCKSVGSTPTGGFDTFLANTGAVPTATDCNFSCKSGYVKSVSTYSCNKAKPCAIADGGGQNRWKSATSTYSTTCEVVDCNTGFVKNTGTNSCDIPGTGKYADNGVAKDCSSITGGTGGFNAFAGNTGAVSTPTGCGFSCNTGFVKSGRSCNFPSLGKYVTAGGIEASCDSNSITTEGTAAATWIAGAASTDTTCPFSCTAGYVKDASAGKCKYPTLGYYADAQGAELSCTDISGIPNFNTWVVGAATADDACPFSCASGYTISGRMCRKARPQTLALGTDTSHVLFDNGEVEAWGEVNAFPWRSHIKEDLRSHTPQALVSGGHHQCIILENAGLNHGSLMCWGRNGDGQLGVGDTNSRSTPTAVTATFLGDAGDGTPKTVKSVSAGKLHTCALLNDDTVKCWGKNTTAQIGGGSGGNKTISGSAGDPLSGKASRIAAGGFHTCAVLSDKSVKCWGYNFNSQTGGGTPILGGSNTATEIAMGELSSCAILNNGSVVCWGHLNTSPNLGTKTAIGVAVGAGHACALLKDKTVKCWGKGRNVYGQVGGGTGGSDRVLRGTVGDPLGGQIAIEIVAGYNHTCAIMDSDHSVKCWGKNTDNSGVGFYGQIIGEVAMTGGSDGTGTSAGETAMLTAASTPTATALDSDANGKVCGLAFAGGAILMNKNYNSGGSTTISNVIESMITAIGSSVTMGGTNITLSRKGSDKIEATVNSAVFEGMTLTIYHDDNGGDCTTTRVGINIPLTGGSGAAVAEGLWVISERYTAGSGDMAVNLDSVHLDLGTTDLSKEKIADKIIAEVNGGSWAGKQYKDLPYTATKLDGDSSDGDDCPDNNFCVVFERFFKGTEGNYDIPFGDFDYEH